MPYLKIDNTNLYYEEKGSGIQTLIFGHSMLFNLRMFDAQVAFLQSNYRCICFDFRGHGKSDSPAGGYDLDTLTDDIASLIKELDASPSHFIGFSMGGMVALRMAIKYPTLIKSLILIDTSSEPQPSNGMLRNKAMLFVAKYLGLKPISRKVISMFFGHAFLKDPNRKALRTKFRKHFEANNRVGVVKAVKGVLYRKGITEKIGAITHPATIMVGAEDELTDLSMAKILNSNLKNSTLEIIPRAGHMGPVEEPEIVNNVIKQHLDRLPH